jgi:hypothetical protein
MYAGVEVMRFTAAPVIFDEKTNRWAVNGRMGGWCDSPLRRLFFQKT